MVDRQLDMVAHLHRSPAESKLSRPRGRDHAELEPVVQAAPTWFFVSVFLSPDDSPESLAFCQPATAHDTSGCIAALALS
jgi:hypothetical protein